MRSITASYRIVTPMFIGGANQDPSDGIRPPSFKGALRFWWRALNWGKFYQDYQNDEAVALKALHQKEGELFGSAAKDGKGGQGIFLLTVNKQPSLNHYVDDWPKGHTERGAESKSGYLGLGLFPMGEHKRRKAISEHQTFDICIRWTAKAQEEDKKSILNACKALGLFGGIGSRNRKAFGSISLESLSGESFKCQTKDDYINHCTRILHRPDLPYLPPYTAASPWTKWALGKMCNDARSAHSALANTYLTTRGQGGDVKGRSKIAFGLPLDGYDEVRRASPLLMHIHPIGDRYTSSCLFLPSDFHRNYETGGHPDFYQGVSTFMSKLGEVQL